MAATIPYGADAVDLHTQPISVLPDRSVGDMWMIPAPVSFKENPGLSDIVTILRNDSDWLRVVDSEGPNPCYELECVFEVYSYQGPIAINFIYVQKGVLYPYAATMDTRL